MEQKWKIRREQIIGSAMEHLRKIQEKSKRNLRKIMETPMEKLRKSPGRSIEKLRKIWSLGFCRIP